MEPTLKCSHATSTVPNRCRPGRGPLPSSTCSGHEAMGKGKRMVTRGCSVRLPVHCLLQAQNELLKMRPDRRRLSSVDPDWIQILGR